MSEPATSARFQRRRDHILMEALRLFAEEGLENVGIKRIAASLGITHPALYHYFGSKEELVTDAVEKAMGDLLSDMRAARTRTPPHPAAQLTSIARAQVMHELGGRNYVPFLNAFLYGPLKRAAALHEGQQQRIAALQREVLVTYRDIVVAGQETGEFVDGPPSVLAFGIMGTLSYTVSWYREDGQLSATEVADTIAAQALRSVSRFSNGA